MSNNFSDCLYSYSFFLFNRLHLFKWVIFSVRLNFLWKKKLVQIFVHERIGSWFCCKVSSHLRYIRFIISDLSCVSVSEFVCLRKAYNLPLHSLELINYWGHHTEELYKKKFTTHESPLSQLISVQSILLCTLNIA